jgi:membrane protein YdbS with pleckstrin-like domain
LPTELDHSENFATAVTEVSERMTVLVREEIELAKAEVTTKVSTIARGAAAVAAGAVFGVFAVVFGLLALAWGLNSGLNSLWLGFLIVFVLLVLLALGTFLFAYRKLRVGPPTPKMAIDEAKLIRETVASKSQDGA